MLVADSSTGRTLSAAQEALAGDLPRTLKTGSLFTYQDCMAYEPDFTGATLRGACRLLPWHDHCPTTRTLSTSDLSNCLIVLHGLVATGKTSTANAILTYDSASCVLIESDYYWLKHGLRNRNNDPSVSCKHNEFLINLCWSVIVGRRHALLDCTSRSKNYRDELRRHFESWNVPVIIVRCHCSAESAMKRIATRYNPRDFGDAFEYERVRREYEPIEAEELNVSNVIDIDTDSGVAEVVNALDHDISVFMQGIVDAVRVTYLSKIDVDTDSATGGNG